MRMFKYEREKNGLTQNELAELLGVSQQTISKYENGTREPDLENLIRMAKIFEVSTDYLLGIGEKNRLETNDGKQPFNFDKEISSRLHELSNKMDVNYDLLSTICDVEPDEMKYFFDYGFLPHIDVLIKLAKYYGVSCDYLLNLSDSKLIIDNKEEEKLIQAFRDLNSDNQLILLGEALKEVREQQNKNYEMSQSVAADTTMKMVK